MDYIIEKEKINVSSRLIGMKYPRRFSGKEPTCQAGDMGSIPMWGRSLSEGNGNPLQYSCLGNSMDRGA